MIVMIDDVLILYINFNVLEVVIDVLKEKLVVEVIFWLGDKIYSV